MTPTRVQTAAGLAILLRDREPVDDGYIVTTWLRAWRDGYHLAALVPVDAYWRAHAPVVRALLARGRTIVAVPDYDGVSHIMGFACGGGGVVHFVYVRGGDAGYRRAGVGKELFRALEAYMPVTRATHMTADGERWLRARGGAVAYAPSLLDGLVAPVRSGVQATGP